MRKERTQGHTLPLPVSRAIINNVVAHLPDPDRGRSPVAVFHRLGWHDQPSSDPRAEKKKKQGAHQIWVGVEDYVSDPSRSE